MANIFSVAGPNSKYKLEGAKPAGFRGGLWHGLIAVAVFIISLFNARVSVWETNNNGRWYEFGFVLGISFFSHKGLVRIGAR